MRSYHRAGPISTGPVRSLVSVRVEDAQRALNLAWNRVIAAYGRAGGVEGLHRGEGRRWVYEMSYILERGHFLDVVGM